MSDFSISTDKSKLDLLAIHDYLSNKSYWAKGRSLETIKISIENSIAFGMYDSKGKQVGFARVATDMALFAYLMDVYILDEYQGKGLGKQLMSYIMNHPQLKAISKIRLATTDAHKFYEQFGFMAITRPDDLMEVMNNNAIYNG